MSDQYEALRSLSFPALAEALGIDLSTFKTRKSGKEHYGPCPIHRPKHNQTSFSYAANGAFHCFSCGAKGRGAIDFVKDFRKEAANPGRRPAISQGELLFRPAGPACE